MAGVYVKRTVHRKKKKTLSMSKKKTSSMLKKETAPAGFQDCRNCGGDGVVRVRKSK